MALQHGTMRGATRADRRASSCERRHVTAQGSRTSATGRSDLALSLMRCKFVERRIAIHPWFVRRKA
jgi:hypothetical protein